MAAACLAAALLVRFCLTAEASNAPTSIPVSEALARHAEKGDVLFVDVRSAESFARLRIPGSLNIPAYAVKTKTFLRGKRVILVNEGFPSQPLESACAALAVGGASSAAILEGGVLAWAERGGPLEGDPLALPDVRLVPQATYAAERERDDVLVVFVGDHVDASRSLLPRAATVSFDAGGEQFLGRLEQEVRRAPGGAPATVLLVDDAGRSYSRLQFVYEARRFRGLRPLSFHCLADGLEGLRRFQQLQSAIADGAKRTRVGGCPDCPQGQSP